MDNCKITCRELPINLQQVNEPWALKVFIKATGLSMFSYPGGELKTSRNSTLNKDKTGSSPESVGKDYLSSISEVYDVEVRKPITFYREYMWVYYSRVPVHGPKAFTS